MRYLINTVGYICRIMSKKCKLDVAHLGTANNSVLQQTQLSTTSGVNTLNTINSTGNPLNYEDVRILPSPIKPESDKKEYTTIQLSNGLRALLISDIPNLVTLNECESESGTESESENELSDVESSSEDSSTSEDSVMFSKKHGVKGKSANDEKLAACALTVGVGSFSDPEEIQGLAHFLEHMLFMGSERYPKENDFDSFINKKGGMDNASTECEHTTYYFECQEKYFLTGMDMFAQFFISPLLKKEAMTREREAIESEFQMALPSDSFRREQLVCSLANDGNPAKKFTWGNLITLRDRVKDDRLHEAVRDFWKTHYSAHRMTLAVQARLPTEILKKWVVQCFSKIPCNNLPASVLPPMKDPFDAQLFNKFFRVEAVQEIYILEVSWALPPVIELYRSKPLDYLSWMIGHEGAGSLTTYLRKHLWASELSSGHNDGEISSNSIYSLFKISVVLSDKGKDDVREVIKAIFSYVKLLQNEGPSERIFHEIKAINEMQFRFSEEETAVDNVENLSENMHYYPPEDFISGSELTFEYKPDEIKTFLNLMTPSNANIILNTHKAEQDVVYDKVEQWFNTRYTSENIPGDFKIELENIKPYEEFHLPKPNHFIATDFSLISERERVLKYPKKCLSNQLVDVYCKPDMKFRLPFGYVGLNIITPMPEISAKNSALLLLYIKMLQFTLIEEIYPANTALLEENISPCELGLNISVYGFSQKLHLLLECIAKGIKNFSKNVNQDIFETYKKMTQRGFINVNLKASPLARDVRISLLVKQYWTAAAKYEAISDVTLEDVKNFADNLFKGVHVQCLVQGNLEESEANQICTKFVEALECTPLHVENWPKIRVHQIPIGEQCCRISAFNREDKNCITTNYFQYGPASIKEYCLCEMLIMLMEEPLFDKLRTQEQLGYDVSCTLRDSFGILGFSVGINSQIDKFSVTHVENRVSIFLDDFIKKLTEMPEEEFIEMRQSLIKIKQCSDVHLKQEVKRNWEEISSCQYIFDRLEKEVQHISNITKEQVIQFLIDMSSKQGKNYRKLIIQVVGHPTNSVDNKPIKREGDETQRDLSYNFLGITEEDSKTVNFISDFDVFKKDMVLFPPSKII